MVKTQKEPKNKPEIKYPLESRINNYGFIFLRKEWLADLGWTKGMAVTIFLTGRHPDGLRKQLPRKEYYAELSEPSINIIYMVWSIFYSTVYAEARGMYKKEGRFERPTCVF